MKSIVMKIHRRPLVFGLLGLVVITGVLTSIDFGSDGLELSGREMTDFDDRSEKLDVRSSPRGGRGSVAESRFLNQQEIELLHESIVGRDYRTSNPIAIAELLADLLSISRVYDGDHERERLLSLIIKRFAAHRLESQPSSVDLVEDFRILRDGILKHCDRVDTAEALRSTGRGFDSSILKLDDEARQEFVGDFVDAAINSKDKDMIDIAGDFHARDLMSREEFEFSWLKAVENAELRKSAMRSVLTAECRNNEVLAVKAAGFYLSEECDIEDDRRIAICLFGVNLNHFPESISKVIFDAPSGIKRDRAIQQMIFRIVGKDRERAIEWSKLVENPEIHKEALKHLEQPPPPDDLFIK